MKISELSVKRPITILMMVMIIITLGFVSFMQLQIDLYPKIEIPVAVVTTSYQGVGPHEIETLISEPLEESLSTVSNIKTVSSISSEGSSMIIVQFNYGTDMDFANLEIREKVDMVKKSLPSDANSPMVLKLDPNSTPVMQIAFTNGEDLTNLQAIIEDKIQSRIERIEGVASVDISGGYEEEIQIKVSQEKLNGYGISLDYIVNILRSENLNLPGGEVFNGDREVLVRTIGELNNLSEIKGLPIPLQTEGVVYLRDIADISLTHKDVSSLNRMNGKSSINMSVQKESSANTVSVAEAVNQELENIKREYPGFNIETVTDQSEYIKKSINSTARSAILGSVLAIAILYFFLRNVRSTFIIGTAIPVSVIATFAILYFSGITINLMTLGGLALGVGMLVDNAIVVLENIYRFREEGYSRIESAKLGAEEVGMAVLASTLTTIAVFLPITFTEGMAAMLFNELALTVTFSLLASLLVSITLVPMLASKILKVEKKHSKRKFGLLTSIFDKFENVFEVVEKMYKGLLKKAITHRVTTIVLALIIFAVSMGSAILVGTEFMPVMDEGVIDASIELPTGSSLEDTNEIVSRVEKYISEIPEIDMINTSVGGGGSMSLMPTGENTGTINIVLVDLAERERSSEEVANDINSLVEDISGAKIDVSLASSGMSGSSAPISIEIKGDDLDELKKISDDYLKMVSGVPGTINVESNYEEGKPEARIILDRKNASNFGLTASQVASTVRTSISGTIATQYKYDGTEIDVKIMGDERIKQSLSNLTNLLISTPMGTNVPLNQVATIEMAKGPTTINRVDQVRTITITSSINGRDLGSVSSDIMKKLDGYELPNGYEYKLGGEREDMMEAFGDLGLALGLAVLLVYMIIASQFESLLNPFIIMFTVPLAIGGGALGLFITGRTLSVPALIGVIMLSGIVVNNAIVLIDYINTLRGKGFDRDEAILMAGSTRLRPILMTTMTTVLGLFPLALGIGEGAEAQAPMATVVISGLLLSTLLTLVFIPVMYIIFDNISKKITGRFRKNKETSES